MFNMIDAHIHWDAYSPSQRKEILHSLGVQGVRVMIAVGMNLKSSRETLELSRSDERVKAAAGFHPEQEIPSQEEIEELFTFLDQHASSLVAVGEVGLPYYRMQDDADLELKPYEELLERFIVKAKSLKKPIVLHCIYEHAGIACDLLERHSVEKAHFHWFKGDEAILERVLSNGYKVSVTPDVMYEDEIQKIVQKAPLDAIMVETDGPWPFEGPFKGQMTHPGMMGRTIKCIASIKNMDESEAAERIFTQTKRFYGLSI
ncbi:TatD family hydrolase [Rossellomorea marisflavi]|uniref:TatD family hydrolase n=1 Tax=Rossellomorea marisflavi TaxID=189381 RepID=UPI00285354D1|nr:TatD family hydrolase [Rossellomorea marisflavi]MDR4937613.1 TatD family hydrolase [Rossellomorea marisflavi]